MNIDPKADFHGFTMLQARDVTKRFPGAGAAWFGWGAACGIIKDEERALALVQALTLAGYLAQSDGEMYQRTELGNQFALASARPIKRTTATRMLEALVDRARALNESNDSCYHVDALVVFGSYLDETRERLGDLDIGYVLSRKFALGSPKAKEEDERSRKRAQAAGRRFTSYEDWLWWPEKEPLYALKARTAGLSLHNFNGVDHNIISSAPHRVVFGELPHDVGGAPDEVR